MRGNPHKMMKLNDESKFAQSNHVDSSFSLKHKTRNTNEAYGSRLINNLDYQYKVPHTDFHKQTDASSLISHLDNER